MNQEFFVFAGRIKEAERVLVKLRGSEMVNDELNGIIFSCQENSSNGEQALIKL